MQKITQFSISVLVIYIISIAILSATTSEITGSAIENTEETKIKDICTELISEETIPKIIELYKSEMEEEHKSPLYEESPTYRIYLEKNNYDKYNNFNTIYYTISSSTLPIDYIIYLKDTKNNNKPPQLVTGQLEKKENANGIKSFINSKDYDSICINLRKKGTYISLDYDCSDSTLKNYRWSEYPRYESIDLFYENIKSLSSEEKKEIINQVLFTNKQIINSYPYFYANIIKTELDMAKSDYKLQNIHLDYNLIKAIIAIESNGYRSIRKDYKFGLMQLSQNQWSYSQGDKSINPDGFNPALNIRAGIKYFLFNYYFFNNIDLTLASFNCKEYNCLKNILDSKDYERSANEKLLTYKLNILQSNQDYVFKVKLAQKIFQILEKNPSATSNEIEKELDNQTNNINPQKVDEPYINLFCKSFIAEELLNKNSLIDKNKFTSKEVTTSNTRNVVLEEIENKPSKVNQIISNLDSNKKANLIKKAIRTNKKIEDLGYNNFIDEAYNKYYIAGSKIDKNLIKAIIAQESEANTQIVNSDQDTGVMQIIPSTWTMLTNLDFRHAKDPQINIEMGTKYLFSNYDSLKDEISAVAAYNCGVKCVQRAIKSKVSKDFSIYKSKIPSSTADTYVPNIIFMWEIFKLLEKNSDYSQNQIKADLLVQGLI